MDLKRSLTGAYEMIEESDGLASAGERLSASINGVYEKTGAVGRKVENALHGAWLGHPLHPAIVALPIGAWGVAQILDAMEVATGSEEYAAGADAAVAIGIAGAIGAAAAGLTDWKDTEGIPRRIGLVHGMLNTVALSLFAGSLAARRSGTRTAGRWLGALGSAVVLASGYLGGHLSYRHKIGVTHADEPGEMAPDFKAVLPEHELREGELRRVMLDDKPLLLVRRRGTVYALSERCAHMGGPLSEGKLMEDDSVVCPWHGSRYALEDGQVLDGPSAYPQPCFSTRVRNGMIEVKAASFGHSPSHAAAQTAMAAPGRTRETRREQMHP